VIWGGPYFPPGAIGIWPSPGVPTHPIAPGGPPPGIWPSPGYPAHPIAPGGPPPSIWPSPGVPTHPIYWPPSIWPDPGYPAHPIAPGGPPPGIWPSPGVPTHPIVLPPDVPPPETSNEVGFFCVAYGKAPCAFIKADSTEAAAYDYGLAFGLPVGEDVLVFTESEAFAVTVDAVEVNPQ
jgi:hypothetical protein